MPSVRASVSRATPSTLKVTLPVAMPGPADGLTVAVNVTGWPYTEVSFGVEDVTTVVVVSRLWEKMTWIWSETPSLSVILIVAVYGPAPW